MESEKKVRNKQKTQQKLLDALGKIIRRDGFRGLGINQIAREARVDKVLIYRYFGNLEGLLQAYAEQQQWLIPETETSPTLDDKDWAINSQIDLFREVQVNEHLQEVMRWSLIENNKLTETLHQERDSLIQAVISRVQANEQAPHLDTEAMAALINGGINFLALQSGKNPHYANINLQSEEGRQRIEQAITQLFEMLYEKARQES
ncbi:MAG: TetR/AcrR family transcriptional regulator [Bacteroidota bacterium]